jgi:hypothetical protein
MDHSPPPQPPDLTLQLPRDIYYQIVHTLRRSLPPPLTASADDRARRDNTAIAEVACLLPANAEEVEIAAQFVAANAQAMVCLRLAQEHADDVPRVLQCTAQSARIMREARGARSLLLRVQTARQKREADNDGYPPGLRPAPGQLAEHHAVPIVLHQLGEPRNADQTKPARHTGIGVGLDIAVACTRHLLPFARRLSDLDVHHGRLQHQSDNRIARTRRLGQTGVSCDQLPTAAKRPGRQFFPCHPHRP